MSRRGDKPAEGGPPPKGPGLWVLAGRFVKTLLIVAAILYVAALVLSRTEGFRTLVEDRLSRAARMKVKIESCHATLGLSVVMRGIRSEETGAVVRAQAVCRRAVVDWALPGPGRRGAQAEVTAEGLEVDLAWVDGQWHPAALAGPAARVAEWLKIPLPQAQKAGGGPRNRQEELLAEAAPQPAVWSGPPLQVSIGGGALRWWTDQPTPVAEAGGLRLAMTPLVVPDRLLTHYLVEAATINVRGDLLAAPVRMELLDTGEQQVLLGLRMGQAAAPAGDSR